MMILETRRRRARKNASLLILFSLLWLGVSEALPPLDAVVELKAYDWETDQEEIFQRIEEFKPTLIRNTRIASPLQNKWTRAYLAEHWQTGTPHTALKSTVKDVNNNYLFPIRERPGDRRGYNLGKFEMSGVQAETAVVAQLTKMKDFAQAKGRSDVLVHIQVSKRKAAGGESTLDEDGEGHAEIISADVGDVIAADLSSVLDNKDKNDNLKMLFHQAEMMPRGTPSCYLWASGGAATTPLKYETFSRVMVHLHGARKHVHIWPPGQPGHLYLSPRQHPRFTSSQVVDIHDHAANSEAFPKFLESKDGVKATVEPGDVLFTPG
jgi:hypothetical protein